MMRDEALEIARKATEAGVRANLSRANLSGANLSEANLSRAYLSRADLSGAYLSRADLSGAYLSEANLSEADLSGADLSRADLYGANLYGADLSEANLSGANLSRTVLSIQSVWDWAAKNVEMRVIGKRTLCLGSRTQNSPKMGGPGYEVGKIYAARWFSACPVTACHPGLYVKGGPDEAEMLVAFWLDEAVVAGDKCRVPRFRTLKTKAEFNRLRDICLDAGVAVVLPPLEQEG